jgi:hypothetical protein
LNPSCLQRLDDPQESSQSQSQAGIESRLKLRMGARIVLFEVGGEVIVRLVAALGVAAVLVLLWLMPGVLFPHPGVNDAIELAFLGPLLFLITLGASLLSLVAVAVLGWRLEGTVGLGMFLVGLAIAFVLPIVVFGNFSDDRFAPLFLTPALALPVGTAILVAGLVMRSRRQGKRLVGAVRGLAAAVLVTLWLLARGATDWLQAPYGFDVYVLITVAAAIVLYLGADPLERSQAAQT